MKLIKEDTPYLTKEQWMKICLSTSILTISLYVIAMVCSLLGSKYFILNYQNTQMDNIEAFFKQYGIFPLLSLVFSTLEFCVILSFINQKLVKFYYPIIYYVIAVVITITLPDYSMLISYFYPLLFYITVPIVEQIIDNKKNVLYVKFKWIKFWKAMLRLLIAASVVFTLQLMIFVIKNGSFSVDNHIQSLSSAFIYAIEYDIALSVILLTISLYIHREKGDSKIWVTGHNLGSSSQTSTKQLQTSNMKKNLTKAQRSKIRLLYIKFYVTQLSAFLLLMVLPFLLGKVFEFLVMYLAFALTRYILGFKYSLHYKKETLCITIGVVVFGILSLAVPFFYVVLILAILLGVSLAILLHFSYKYKSFYLFNKISRPDKFAEVYVIFDGDLTEYHVKKMCTHYGLDKLETQIMWEFASGEKISVLAFKHNYSVKTIERELTRIIDKIKERI